MAHSPKVLTEAQVSDTKEVDRLESIIDEGIELKRRYYQGGDVWISLPEYPSRPIYEELKRRYLAQNWKAVRLENDQREGTSIVLTP